MYRIMPSCTAEEGYVWKAYAGDDTECAGDPITEYGVIQSVSMYINQSILLTNALPVNISLDQLC